MREIVEETTKNLTSIPPDWEKVRLSFSHEDFSQEELAYMAYESASWCSYEFLDAQAPLVKEAGIDSMHSGHLLDCLQFLLEKGLNPNATVNGDDNVLWELMWVDAPNLAAKALRMLLENGGDPNLRLASEPETLFEYVAFMVSFDEHSPAFFHIVQFWLVLMAYGGCRRDGTIPLKMLNGNSVDIFKDFEKYDYCIEPFPQGPENMGCWIMHIYEIATKTEVARY